MHATCDVFNPTDWVLTHVDLKKIFGLKNKKAGYTLWNDMCEFVRDMLIKKQ